MVIIAAIVLLGVLIFVHELGHFLVCKLAGVRVLKFSLGYGPAILSWKRGGTEYCISAFPLGGFVKMLGEETGDDVSPSDAAVAFPNKPVWVRSLIVIAGPLFNIVFPIIIFFFLSFSLIEDYAPVVNIVIPGKPAALAGMKEGDRIVAINGKKVRTWNDVLLKISGATGRKLDVEVARVGAVQKLGIVPEATIGYDKLGEEKERGKIGISPNRVSAQVVVEEGSAAWKAGLRSFDVIKAVAGGKIYTFKDLEAAVAAGAGGKVRFDFVRSVPLPVQSLRAAVNVPASFDVEIPADGASGLGLARAVRTVEFVEPGTPAEEAGIAAGDEIIAAQGQPIHTFWTVEEILRKAHDSEISLRLKGKGGEREARFRLKRYTGSNKYGQPYDIRDFGAYGGSPYIAGDKIKWRRGPIAALGNAMAATAEVVNLTFKGIGKIISGKISVKALGGPLMIFDIAGKAAKEGFNQYVKWMALISINLGVLNLLPIPILDGGVLTFFAIEAVRRKPLSLKAREIAGWVGLSLLCLLVGLVFWNDIQRYWGDFMKLFR